MPGPTGLPVARSHTTVDAALVGDAHRLHRAALVGQGQGGHLEHGGGHRGGVELDQPGERCVGKNRLVVDVLHRALGPDDAGPYARGADVDDEHAHRQPAPAPTVTALLLPGRPAPTVTVTVTAMLLDRTGWAVPACPG